MSVKTFRIVALAEACSFLVLLVFAVLKRTSDFETGVTVMGPVHGALFVGYVYIALQLREPLGWTPKETGLVLLGAVLPFGGFAVDRWLATREQSSARA